MNSSVRHHFCVSYPLLAVRILTAVDDFKAIKFRSPTIYDLSRMMNVSEESILEAMELNAFFKENGYRHSSQLIC